MFLKITIKIWNTVSTYQCTILNSKHWNEILEITDFLVIKEVIMTMIHVDLNALFLPKIPKYMFTIPYIMHFHMYASLLYY